MVAMISLPGSTKFKYFVGTVTACKNWLADRRAIILTRGEQLSAYAPFQIVNNRIGHSLRYLDGRPVIKFRPDDSD